MKIPFPTPKAVLSRFELQPKKSFGQNFLCDANAVERIAELVPEGANVFEIGAGLGGLTAALLNRGHRVIAIERDRDLLPVLRDVLAEPLESGQLTLLEADAKSVDYTALMDGWRAEDAARDTQTASHTDAKASPQWVLCGNLPYQITGLLLQLAVSLAPRLARAVFMVQLEVADRLAAAPGSDAYGALSVFTQAAFQARRAFVVRRGAFSPQPNVDSAVITLTPLNPPRAQETDLFRMVVKSAFHQRRKTLRNAWKSLPDAAESVAQAAATAGVSLDARGETLSVDDFARVVLALEGLRGAEPGDANLVD